jgi:hypothetical protein
MVLAGRFNFASSGEYFDGAGPKGDVIPNRIRNVFEMD